MQLWTQYIMHKHNQRNYKENLINQFTSISYLFHRHCSTFFSALWFYFVQPTTMANEWGRMEREMIRKCHSYSILVIFYPFVCIYNKILCHDAHPQSAIYSSTRKISLSFFLIHLVPLSAFSSRRERKIIFICVIAVCNYSYEDQGMGILKIKGVILFNIQSLSVFWNSIF